MEKVKITFHLNLKNYPQNKSKVVNFTCCKLLQNTTKSVIYLRKVFQKVSNIFDSFTVKMFLQTLNKQSFQSLKSFSTLSLLRGLKTANNRREPKYFCC